MSQHFLLSASARTLSLAKVMRLSDEEAYETFKSIRWPDGMYCPRCGCVDVYTYKSRKIYKCKGCEAQFSITTATIFASRKLSIRDLLAAIAIFANGAKGYSALQLSRDLDVQYKTAFVLTHKLREAMSAEMQDRTLSGIIEIDGAYFGGYVKPQNRKEDRVDRRLSEHQTGKRRAVVVMREREGDTLTHVVRTEGQALPFIMDRAERGSTIYADEASVWDDLHSKYEARRINHSVAYMDEGVCTNQAESFFSRLRRAEIGTHHHIAGPYLYRLALVETHFRDSQGV